NFVFTDQAKLVELIRDIYGVDVKKYPKYNVSYGRYTWCKMLEDTYMDICDPLKSYVQRKIDEDEEAAAAEGGEGEGEGYTPKYSDSDKQLFSEYKSALKELKSLYSSADGEAKKAAKGKSSSLKSVSSSLLDQMIKVQDLAIAVANRFNYTKVKNISNTAYPNSADHGGPWMLNYWDKKKYNEIKVNFN
ncbi:MAG: hypothetical protein IJI82_04265, partial [Clostridia bacterium]|nr:hypothetical protein [Clostridia bacterium]